MREKLERDSGERKVRVPFDGNKKSFIFWQSKFKGKVNKEGFLPILDRSWKIPYMAEYNIIKAIPEADRTPDQIADAHAYKMNVCTYYELILLMDCTKTVGVVAWCIVNNNKTDKLPYGDAKAGYDEHNGKYQPVTSSDHSHLASNFAGEILKDSQHPSVWFSVLEQLQGEMNDINSDQGKWFLQK